MKFWKRALCLGLGALLAASALPVAAGALSEEDLTAPSAVLMEASTGKVLFEKNSHEVRACASITKVMTLLLVMEAIDQGRMSLTDTITASEHASSMGGSDIWLEPGETMSADDMGKGYGGGFGKRCGGRAGGASGGHGGGLCAEDEPAGGGAGDERHGF